MLATSYPLLNLFMTILYLFLFVLWLFVLFRVIYDLFSSKDLSGWGKAGWFIFILVLPLVGVLVYLVARGDKMERHEEQAAAEQRAALDSYIRQVAATSTPVAELTKLHELKSRGAITDAEYDELKAKVIDTSRAAA